MEHHDHEGVAAFYHPDQPLTPGTAVSLGETLLHHVRVRRLGVGTAIALLDGEGHRATGTLVRFSRSAAMVEVDSLSVTAPPPAVHLLVPIADRERMLWLAEKCTELGATSWRPILYRRSRSVKPRGEGPTFAGKLRARMVAALEQSGGVWLPAIYPESTLERTVGALPPGTNYILHPTGTAMAGVSFGAPVILAIGPEGGFEPDELTAFESAGFQRVALGGNILRFETAAVAALAITRSALELTYHAHAS